MPPFPEGFKPLSDSFATAEKGKNEFDRSVAYFGEYTQVSDIVFWLYTHGVWAEFSWDGANETGHIYLANSRIINVGDYIMVHRCVVTILEEVGFDRERG